MDVDSSWGAMGIVGASISSVGGASISSVRGASILISGGTGSPGGGASIGKDGPGGAGSMRVIAGSKVFRKRLFLVVSRPEPSTFIKYLSWGWHSTTVPVLSHFLGEFPVWFWIKQCFPTFIWGRTFACAFKVSEFFVKRARRAVSLEAQASRQVGWTATFEYFSSRLMNLKASRMGRPKIIWAGEILQSGSGVFLSWRRARRSLSLSRVPDELVFALRSLLADFTATSARPFDCGWYADDFRCLIPHLVRNS